LASLIALALFGCSKHEASDKTQNANSSQSASQIAANVSQEGAFTCDLAPEELVSSQLGIPGLKLVSPKTSKYPGFINCQYENKAVNAHVGLYFKKSSPEHFAAERKQVEAFSKDTASLDGIGDEAYHGTTGSKKVVVQIVGARKKDLFVSVSTAAADLPKVKALAAKLLESR
jgi:hypothetical protein